VEDIYFIPTLLCRLSQVEAGLKIQTATVAHEEVRALHVFRNEEQANDYRCAEVIFPEEDGFYTIPMDAEARCGAFWRCTSACTS